MEGLVTGYDLGRSPDQSKFTPVAQLATAEEQDMVDLNDINDPDINFHYSLPSTSQMRTRLPATTTVYDRYNVSDRAAAAIAVLQDFGIISESDISHVVDKNKVRRERSL
ncbi:hypothetical protein AVEN_185048-1 [Araneus ventricosus]|uniref:Uncharacterized protein n=1 Tax=Araneus ventricosus TaxID=182803 RepID=A0A4Y2BPF7_ARAVE|nr:hypothetical protein AVEN_185048-1 [Araneus ventricosus]